MSVSQGEQTSRYERLVRYLAEDPANLTLLADAAHAAWSEGRLTEVTTLLDRHAASAPLPPSLINLLGLTALAERRPEDAEAIFSSLLIAAPDSPGLRYNLAWAKDQMGDHEGALATLSGLAGTPQEATLAVRSLHHLGRLEEALAIGEAWEGRDASPDLWGTLAAVALDIEDFERARRWSERAGEDPDGLAARGVLAFADGRTQDAALLFQRTLAVRPTSARAHLGLGSVLLHNDNPSGAAEQFDIAARTFSDHAGSWVAAGWAWLLAGDRAQARARFETVIDLDDTFGEAHGGLAVLDIMDGRLDEARQRAAIASRLDRQGLGGALASLLILEMAGDLSGAERVWNRAVNASIGPNGQTLRQLLADRTIRGQ